MDNKPLQVNTNIHHGYRKEVTSPTELQTRDYKEVVYNDYGFLSTEIAEISKNENDTPVADESLSPQRRNSNVSILQTPVPQVNMTKIVLVMVGLPARGKSLFHYHHF